MKDVRDLARLIADYQRLSARHDAESRRGAVVNAGHLAQALDDAFFEIVRFPSEDPLISCTQIEFLLEILAEASSDRAQRHALRDEVLAHVRRLAAKASVPPRSPELLAAAEAAPSR
ncbi:MAG: hypothetical protein JSS20_17615 [Proteobacteria bacterium]|nr:hypothetical protein [Pseudomonadota bacterium]